jgi:FkbM family methyltransferase
MFGDVIPRLLGLVPLSWRRTIIGPADSPSRLATQLHNLLNFIPPTRSQVFVCKGALEGYRMRVDWNRFRSFVYGTWEPGVLTAVLSTVKPGMTVIDIGAHIGYYTLVFAKCVGSAGSVVSFEPLPDNFDLLQANVEVNRLKRVQTFRHAVFSRTGELTITVPDDFQNSGDASVMYSQGKKQFRVTAVTLDSFCSASGVQPDFLKLDVEGAEYEVLLGGKNIIAQFRPVMLVELHHFDRNSAGHPVPDLLRDWGYEVRWIERFDMTSHILALAKATSSGGPQGQLGCAAMKDFSL